MSRFLLPHESPPGHIQDALAEDLIPTLRDPLAEPVERIQAILELGRTGYVQGAEALIDLLTSDQDIPAEELVWSLEVISGPALGDDVEGWSAWLDDLPDDLSRASAPPFVSEIEGHCHDTHY
jgi:hypothetical protein